MKQRPSTVLLLFTVGAAAGLIGDHSHVITGTTEYLPAAHAWPFVWSSPLNFPVVVGAATVILAELRLHLPSVRTDVTARQAVAGIGVAPWLVPLYFTFGVVAALLGELLCAPTSARSES